MVVVDRLVYKYDEILCSVRHGGHPTSRHGPPVGTRTRTNTNPNDTEANAAGRSGNARALRKQNECGVYHEGEGHWPKFSQKLQKARNLWVARTPQTQ